MNCQAIQRDSPSRVTSPRHSALHLRLWWERWWVSQPPPVGQILFVQPVSWICPFHFWVVKKKMQSKIIQLTLEQYGFELHRSSYAEFFNSKYYNTTQSVVGWIWMAKSADVEPWIWRNCKYRGTMNTEEPGIQRTDCKLYTDLQPCWGSAPLTPALFKGPLCFFTHKTYVKLKFHCPSIKFYWRTATPMHLLVLSVAAFAKQQSCCKVAAETAWPTKLKIYTIWPFTEKVCQPLS